MGILELLKEIIVFIVCFGILVFVHEFGHYIFARMLGVKVLKFSIGFWKPIYSFTSKKSGIEYAIAWIPLGGYVKMLDSREVEVDESEKDVEFNNKALWRRALIVFAGPLFNFVLAVLVFWSLFFFYGTKDFKPYIGGVAEGSMVAEAGLQKDDLITAINGEKITKYEDLHLALMLSALEKKQAEVEYTRGSDASLRGKIDFSEFKLEEHQKTFFSDIGFDHLAYSYPAYIGGLEQKKEFPAAKAGLKDGDLILSIDGTKIRNWPHISEVIKERGCKELSIEVLRDGEKLTFSLWPTVESKNGIERYIIGVGGYEDALKKFRDEIALKQINIEYGVGESFVQGVVKTYRMPGVILRGLWSIATGTASIKGLSGPIQIYGLLKDASKMGPYYVLSLLAMLSISLGVLNLLPIPVLDGGHLLYYLVEFVTRKKVNEKILEYGMKVGLAFLLSLMVLVFYMDIEKLVSEDDVQKELINCESKK